MTKEIKSKALAFSPNFAYISQEDRFILDRGPASLKFNIIGCGVNGQEHLRVTALEGRALVHGIYDPHPASVFAAQTEHARFSDNPLKIYPSLQAACQDPQSDALIICTPNYTHLEVLKVAMSSGKPILLEKPIATTLTDAFEIVRLAKDYPSVFQVGLQYRFKAIYQEAIYEALVRKSLGEIKLLSLSEHRMPFLDKVKQWNKFSQYSGNTLIEKCCHYFDLLNLFAGSQPKRVYAIGSQAVNFLDFEYQQQRSDILDNAMVTLQYQNGVQASFQLCMFAPMFYEELVICGDEGRLKAWENEDFLPNSPSTYLELLHDERKVSRRMNPHYPALIEQSGHHGATYYEHVAFINQILGQPGQAATALEGLWSIIVAAAAQESIIQGQPIALEPFLEARGLTL